MSQLYYLGQRVLTTKQLADVLKTSTRVLNRNFQRNGQRYQEGKHYFALTGEVLRQWKAAHCDLKQHTAILYLWTLSGARQHTLSLRHTTPYHVQQLLKQYEEDEQWGNSSKSR